MATDSSFSPFKPASGDWEGYAARFNFLLQAKEVTNDAMKRATFFSVCGEETFEIARALLAPRDVATVSYKTIMERLKEHFSPQPSVVACRNAFYAKRQAPGETITGFVTSLRQAARLCNFSELENMLRDRLVGGLRDEMLQRRLYAKKDLTFQIALEEALATEAAERSTQEARPAPPSQPRVYHEDLTDESESDKEEVHRVQRRTQAAHTPQQPRREGGNCASCGENHERRTCRFRNAECRQCRKLGHIARVCRARLTRRQASDDRPRSPRSHGTMHQGNSTEITDYQAPTSKPRGIEQMLADSINHSRKYGLWQRKEEEMNTTVNESRAQEVTLNRTYESMEKLDKEDPVWLETLERAKAADERRRSLARQARDDYKRLSLQGTRKGKVAGVSAVFKTGEQKRPLPPPPPLPPKPKHLSSGMTNGKPDRKHTVQRTVSTSTQEAIIRWFKEEQQPLRAGFEKSTGQVAPWFHGILTTKKAEELLSGLAPGSFLIRVSEKIKGYVLSYLSAKGCKHFLIDASGDSCSFLGVDQQQHSTLADLVDYHKEEPITSFGKEILCYPCGQQGEEPDYLDLFE